MRPVDLYRDQSIRKTFQLGIAEGYPAGKYERVRRLGGLIQTKEARVSLPGEEGEYYDTWWFPGHSGVGFDQAKTPLGQITRRYFGRSTRDPAKAIPTLQKHIEILRLAKTDTRLDEPFVLEDGIWLYKYRLLFPPIGPTGMALALETLSMEGETTFVHLFGLFPGLSGKVPVPTPALGVLC